MGGNTFFYSVSRADSALSKVENELTHGLSSRQREIMRQVRHVIKQAEASADGAQMDRVMELRNRRTAVLRRMGWWQKLLTEVGL